MANESYSVSEQELRALEARVEELIRACAHLKEENKGLRRRQDQLTAEKAGLAEKSELAKSRVEAMISRLKSLEPGT
jgi:cell division protein ZapB